MSTVITSCFELWGSEHYKSTEIQKKKDTFLSSWQVHVLVVTVHKSRKKQDRHYLDQKKERYIQRGGGKLLNEIHPSWNSLFLASKLECRENYKAKKRDLEQSRNTARQIYPKTPFFIYEHYYSIFLRKRQIFILVEIVS